MQENIKQTRSVSRFREVLPQVFVSWRILQPERFRTC